MRSNSKKTNGAKIAECHGLDPAGPGYDGCSKTITLQESDCALVQVIHTDAQVMQQLP